MSKEQYRPETCGVSNTEFGVAICRANCTPCALVVGKKCYIQVVDEIFTKKEAQNEGELE